MVRYYNARASLPERNNRKCESNRIGRRVDVVGNGEGIVEGNVNEFERPCGADRKLRIPKDMTQMSRKRTGRLAGWSS